ncbi:NAD/NADP octopine/nopaline dehydrogenase [Caballeronia mineralivorans PML1(12)]|uniref:2-dehydropantoate 2-reductase n=1 Tax=Caballeronia mineralivorans PML1(12) TaxID=908627 RepID=A0A0J1FQ84_9BURK|nr:NAD/NADP-dependent octopine/nopaline dehydrogenase family protein [Caballeronia mineralivorans]KLU21913.1 NAD/NADP octopine/nopaline dehydrogenase [Caballeronia mineralivorans PML1(12)]
MRVSILGAGAIAYGTAAYLAQAGHDPMLWSPSGKRTRELAAGQPLTAIGAISGSFALRVASSCAEAIGDADVVMFALPGYGHKFALEAAAPHVREGQPIIISSHMSFGALYLSKLLAARGIRAPIIAWSTTLLTGRQLSSTEVKVGTVRQKVDMATLPEGAIDEGHSLCLQIFGDRFGKRDGLLAIALSNLNPQNHLGIALLNLTRMEHGEEWSQSGNITPTVGRLIEALDLERLAIAKTFDLPVKTVQEHFSLSYRIPPSGVSEMSQEMHRRGLGGSGPKTVDSRYVLEDVPFGLLPTILLSQLTGSKAILHESGIAIFSAAYGCDFAQKNDILPELGLQYMSVAELQRLTRVGYESI